MAVDPYDFWAVLLFAIFLPLYGAFVTYPKFLKAVAADPSLRLRNYVIVIVYCLCFTAFAVVVWPSVDRPFAAIGLTLSTAPSFLSGLAAAVAVALVQFAQAQRILANEHRRAVALKQMERVLPWLPHTAEEFKMFVFLALSVGLWEEIFWRGYLPWFLGHDINQDLALIVSCALFGVAHLYQGWRGVVLTGLIGLVFAGVYVLTGSLWVSMVLHALTLLSTGRLTLRLLQCEDSSMPELNPS